MCAAAAAAAVVVDNSSFETRSCHNAVAAAAASGAHLYTLHVQQESDKYEQQHTRGIARAVGYALAFLPGYGVGVCMLHSLSAQLQWRAPGQRALCNARALPR